MTSKKLRNKHKSRIKSVIKVILVFLFAICSTAILIIMKRNNLAYEERIFYLVSVSSEQKESFLEPKKELLKNLGGANLVYKKNNSYYLIASVYLELESAEEIKANLVKYFPDTKILKVKTKKINRKTITQIRDNIMIEKLVKKLYEFSKEFQELQFDYLAGKCSESVFLREMVQKKLELNNINNKIETNDEFSKKVYEFSELFTLKLTSFLSGLDISRSKRNYVCNYFVGFYFDYIEFCLSI